MMGAGSIDFTDEISRVATAMGCAPSPQRIETIQEVLRTFASIDPDTWKISVKMDGNAVDLTSWITHELQHAPRAAVSADPSPSQAPRRAIGGSDLGAALAAGHAAELAREIATWPNPWNAKTFNRTRQAVITNHSQNLAARLKKEAK